MVLCRGIEKINSYIIIFIVVVYHRGRYWDELSLVDVERFRFTSARLFLHFRSQYTMSTCSCTVGQKTSTIQYGYGNVELMQECFPKHSRKGTERMKYDEETEEEGKKRVVCMERSKGSKKE